MSHGHDVDNCSLRYCRKGRQLDLGESRSPTPISQQNLQPVSHRSWAYVYTFSPGLMVVMVMVMVMVLVMVTVMVPKALSPIGWLHQRPCHSFNRVKAFYWPKLPQTKFNRTKDPCGNATPAEKRLSPVRLWGRLSSKLLSGLSSRLSIRLSCRLSCRLSIRLSIRLSSGL